MYMKRYLKYLILLLLILSVFGFRHTDRRMNFGFGGTPPPPSGTSAILQEDSVSFIFQEDGTSKILQE